MLAPLTRAERSFLLLAFAAFLGWSSCAYFAWSSHSLAEQVTTLSADQKAAITKLEALQSAAGEVGQAEAKLSAARMEYSRVTQASTETKSAITAAQQELATLTKRLEQAKDRAAPTGSIRPVEATKRAAR